MQVRVLAAGVVFLAMDVATFAFRPKIRFWPCDLSVLLT